MTEIVTVERIGQAGDGLAKTASGEFLYLPATLPGEKILLSETLPPTPIDFLIRSPERREPACAYFPACGGCSFLHWDQAAQQKWKADSLLSALKRAAVPVPDLRMLISKTGRRRLSLTALRQEDQQVVLGFHSRKSTVLIPLTECIAVLPQLNRLFAPLKTLLYGLSCFRQKASVVINDLTSGPDILLCFDGEPGHKHRALLTAFAREQKLSRISLSAPSFSEPEILSCGSAPYLLFDEVKVTPPPGAFLQASADGEEQIRRALTGLLPASAKKGAELYCGIGSFTFALAKKAATEAFEVSPEACEALRNAAKTVSYGRKITVTERNLERRPLSRIELLAYDFIVLDPPFAGASKQVEQIAKAKVPAVLYISCNPQTLAKDVAFLVQEGYQVTDFIMIDQFLNTPNIEAVIKLSLPPLPRKTRTVNFHKG